MSDRTAARLNRILAMLPWVMAHPDEATVDEVCRRFDYTPRELARDLDLVMLCGLPGYYPDDLMYASIVGDEVVVEAADYFAGARRLTAGEGLRLLSAARATDAAGAGSEALRSAAAKLAAVLLPDGEGVAVDVPDEPEALAAVRDAVEGHERLHITYRGLNRETDTERTIDPWQVFTDLGLWYVDAHDHLADDHRRFRLDRIRRVAPTGETFEPPDDLPEPVATYQPGPDDIRVVLRLRPAARWVAEYYPVTVLGTDGNDLRVEFSSSGPAVPVRLLLRLGPHAELESGDEVAEALVEARAALLVRYDAD